MATDELKNMNPIELRRQFKSCHEEQRQIIAEAEADGKLTEEHRTRLNELKARMDDLESTIEVVECVVNREQIIQENTGTNAARDRERYDRKDREDREFSGLSDYALCVRDHVRGQAGKRQARFGEYYSRAATTYGSEEVGADGGFLVPPDFREEIIDLIGGETSLLPLITTIPTSRNVVQFPVDEQTPWASSGGIQVYWDGEADTYTQVKPALKGRQISLDKLTALVPASDELLADAPMLAAYLTRAVAKRMASKINLAIVQGTGAGMPLGILNAPCLKTASAVGSQTADTFVGMNAITMYSGMLAEFRMSTSTRWLVNQDVEPQILTLMKVGKLDTGGADTGWGVSLFIGPGALPGAPNGAILGKAIFPTQACETVGDAGDVIFGAMDQYWMAQRTAAPDQAMSIHLWFDQSVTAFRFVWRMGGQPLHSSTIAARDGSATYSPFVALEAR
jgi:HK97 family phage major capsid protein